MKRLGKILLILLLIGGVFITGCNKSAPSKTTTSSACCEDSAMAHFTSEPERAIALLDSAVTAGNLSAPRAKYLKAMVVYAGLSRPDSCIDMCKEIFDDEMWKSLPDSEKVDAYQVDVCQLIATAATANNDYADLIHFAKKGAEIAHGKKNLAIAEADLYSRMGYVTCLMGQTAAGMAQMQKADQMIRNNASWESLVAQLNNDKKMVYVLNGTDQYAQALQLLRKMLNRLDEVKANPRSVKNAPEFIVNDSNALNEFIDFHHTEFYQYLVKSYLGMGQRDSALLYLAKFEATPEANNPQMSKGIVIDLVKLGLYDKARTRIAILKDFFKTDTIQSDYAELLITEALADKMEGNVQGANALYRRVLALKDSVNMRNNSSQLTRLATEFNLQDEHMARQDAEMKFKVTLFIGITVVLLIILLVAFLQMRQIKKKHKKVQQLYDSSKEELADTREQLEDTREQLDVANQKINDLADPEKDALSPEELYRRAKQVMDEQKPYTSPDFNIQTLSRLIFSSRTYTSAAINTGAGMNFRKWLANYRVEMAKSMLSDGQKHTMEEIVSKCGFESRSTFYRQFHTITGMTPKEWLDSLSQAAKRLSD